MDILSYLQDNNIVIGEDRFYNKCTYSKDENTLKKQIDLIIELQMLLKKQKSTIIPRVESAIGKDLENFKVLTKKNKKNIVLLKNSESISNVDNYIIEIGEKIIERAEKTLESIVHEAYIELIKRSMNNYEICLGRVDENNIRLDSKGIINIRTIKYISYNLIEHDIYNFIKKLKRRGYEGDINKLMQYFICNASLSDKSLEYLKAIINYPIEEMKMINKYFCKSEKKTPNQWRDEMNFAIKNDGKELYKEV